MPDQEVIIGSGFTEGELKFSSFWVRHELEIRRSARVLLIAINALFWGYALWGVLDAYVISYPIESRITQSIAENAFVAQRLQSNRPRSVQTSPVQVFQGTDSRLDMVVAVTNPNDQWYAEFTYRFNVSGEQTAMKSGFLMPKQSAYLGEFGFAPQKTGGKTSALIVENLVWKRVDPAIVGQDFAAWMASHDDFKIEDLETKTNLTIGTRKATRTRFILKNPTPYGYWNVGIYVLLHRANAPVAVNYITISEFKPGESRVVETDWYETLPSITETEVVPVVNFFDSSAYLPSERF